MRILFDQGAPVPIARFLIGHTVRTALQEGWDRFSNGNLLRVAEAAGFEVLLTTDNNLAYQQNLKDRNIAIVVLSRNRLRLVQRDPENCRRRRCSDPPAVIRSSKSRFGDRPASSFHTEPGNYALSCVRMKTVSSALAFMRRCGAPAVLTPILFRTRKRLHRLGETNWEKEVDSSGTWLWVEAAAKTAGATL